MQNPDAVERNVHGVGGDLAQHGLHPLSHGR